MPNLRKSQSRTLQIIVLWTVVIWAGGAHAQFLRLGPFDFSSKLTVEGIYTTNVEQKRPSETDAEQEDWYLLTSLDLQSVAILGRNTEMKIDTGVSVEKHVNRSDLDNSTRPFARGRVQTSTQISRYTLDLNAGYERTSESAESQAFIGDSRLTRREKETYGYGAQLLWEYDPFRVSFSYEESSDRYVAEIDQPSDQDEVGYTFEADWAIAPNLKLRYSYDSTKTTLINVPESDSEWKTTERIILDWRLLIWENPEFKYGLGLEKENDGDWEPIHIFSLRYQGDLSKTTRVKLFATYEIEQTEEDDDIAFTYGASIENQISDTALQSLSAVREPLDTFGSTVETDSTTYTYVFRKSDLFIYNLSFNFSVAYEIKKPLGPGEEENLWRYLAGLIHSVPVSRQMTRYIKYSYSLEDSNLFPDVLEEHRVTLGYSYQF